MAKKKTVSFNVIDTFCQLSEALAGSGDRYLHKVTDTTETATPKKDGKKTAKPEDDLVLKNITLLSDYLHISPQACLVFVAIYSLELSTREDIDWCDICNYFGLNAIKSLHLRSYLNELVKNKVVNCQNPNGMLVYRSYCVHQNVEDAIDQNIPYNKKEKAEKLDRYQFCDKVGRYIYMNDWSQEKLFKAVEKMEQRHAHLQLVKQLETLKLDTATRICFYDMCDNYVNSNSNQNTNIYNSLKSIYHNLSESMSVIRLFLDKKHPLQENGLVELCPFEYAQNAEAALTEKGKRLLLEDDYDLFTMGQSKNKNLIRPESIQEKRLYFNDKTMKQLSMLKNSLMDKQLAALQQRLEDNTLPKGVTVLLYGEPGTGKTEAVKQLAKASGRSVFHVDISECKSMWFGESEKIVKQLFDNYREMCKREPITPILLFNEADAIFSKRKDVSTSNVAQTENAIQNILLEEMEKLDGILIATTNLSLNFDDAFARRFLFKIPFEKPSVEAKTAIWKDKLPWLNDQDAYILAQKHDLSGGEIDNVARKSLMEEVINGERPELDSLLQWCEEEHFGHQSGPTIGFVA